MTELQITWFILITVLFIGYSILDGFDLGVGVLHLFTKSEKEKVENMSAIAPFWDGNEVWLITAGGALFAAFPAVNVLETDIKICNYHKCNYLKECLILHKKFR